MGGGEGGNYAPKTIQINCSFNTSDAIKPNFKFKIYNVDTPPIKKKMKQKPDFSKLYCSCFQTVLKRSQFRK